MSPNTPHYTKGTSHILLSFPTISTMEILDIQTLFGPHNTSHLPCPISTTLYMISKNLKTVSPPNQETPPIRRNFIFPNSKAIQESSTRQKCDHKNKARVLGLALTYFIIYLVEQIFTCIVIMSQMARLITNENRKERNC